MTKVMEQAKQNVRRKVDNLSLVDRTALTAVMYNLMFTNDCAVSMIQDAFEELEKTGLSRHKIKRWVGVTKWHIKVYNQSLNEHTGGLIDFLADLYEMWDEEIKADIIKLKNSAIMVLNKHKIKYAKLIAYIYIATSLITESLASNDHCMDSKDFKNIRYFHSRFTWLRLTDVHKAFGNAVIEIHKVLRMVDAFKLMDDDLNVNNGFKVIAHRFNDPSLILKVCGDHAKLRGELDDDV